jgi:hypothetical protein
MVEKETMLAQCSDAQLDRIRALEKQLGGTVVAYAKRPVLAALSNEQLERLEALEEELGLILVVYESGSAE